MFKKSQTRTKIQVLELAQSCKQYREMFKQNNTRRYVFAKTDVNKKMQSLWAGTGKLASVELDDIIAHFET